MPAPEEDLSTMHRNALSQHFDRRDFTAEELAGLDYRDVARLPKVGAEGLRAIRAWLHKQGLDLRNVPIEQEPAPTPGPLQWAIRLLERHGYRVIAPRGAAPPR
jgi:hypothetical protein